jgi:hypothetical protein
VGAAPPLEMQWQEWVAQSKQVSRSLRRHSRWALPEKLCLMLKERDSILTATWLTLRERPAFPRQSACPRGQIHHSSTAKWRCS